MGPYDHEEHYPQLDYMYTEDGDRILIEHDLASDEYPELTDLADWYDDPYCQDDYDWVSDL